MTNKGKIEELHYSDWYFGNLPETQLTACCYYEYARSSKVLVASIEEVLNAVDYYEENPRAEFAPYLTRYFPHTAWQKIPLGEREELIHRFETEDKRNALIFSRERLDWEEDEPWTPVFPKYGPYLIRNGKATVAVIQLDWERSNDDLKAAFQRLLRKHRPKGTGPGKGRVGSESDWLKALGAKRLMTHYGSEDPEFAAKLAYDAMQKQIQAAGGIITPPYAKAKSLSLAAKRAKGYLLKLYESDLDRQKLSEGSETEHLWAPAIYPGSPPDPFWE